MTQEQINHMMEGLQASIQTATQRLIKGRNEYDDEELIKALEDNLRDEVMALAKTYLYCYGIK